MFTSLLLDDVLLSAVSFNNLNRYLPFQTSVMHQVLENPDEKYWNNSNIEKCTVDSLKRLHQGLKEDKIPDVFFNNVNLLDRVKDKKLQSECAAHFERLLKNYEWTGNISDIFPTSQSVEPKNGGSIKAEGERPTTYPLKAGLFVERGFFLFFSLIKLS